MHNRSHCKRHQQSFDDDDDDDDDNDCQLQEELERLVRLEHFFENALKDNRAKFMQVRIELKTVLKARAKIASLEFEVFSPTIIRNKKVTR